MSTGDSARFGPALSGEATRGTAPGATPAARPRVGRGEADGAAHGFGAVLPPASTGDHAVPPDEDDDGAMPPPPSPGGDAFAEFDAGPMHAESTRIDESEALAEQSTAILDDGPAFPFLFVEAGKDRGREYVLQEGETSIGRGIDNDVILADVSVSRKHVRVIRDGATITLRDLGSGNGSLVNGRKAHVQQLAEGDRIEIGETILVLRVPGGAGDDAAQVATDASPGATSETNVPVSGDVAVAGAVPFATPPSYPQPTFPPVSTDSLPLPSRDGPTRSVVLPRRLAFISAAAVAVLASMIGASVATYLGRDETAAVPLAPGTVAAPIVPGVGAPGVLPTVPPRAPGNLPGPVAGTVPPVAPPPGAPGVAPMPGAAVPVFAPGSPLPAATAGGSLPGAPGVAPIAPTAPVVAVAPTPPVGPVAPTAPEDAVEPTTPDDGDDERGTSGARSGGSGGRSGGSGGGRAAALAAYRAANFGEAARLAREAATHASARDRRALEQLANDIESFSDLYPRVRDVGERYSTIERIAGPAFRLDRSISGGHFTDDLRTRYVSWLVSQGESGFSGDPVAACGRAISASGLDSSNARVRALVGRCETRASDMLAEATRVERSDPARAQTLYRNIARMLPASHATARDAARRLAAVGRTRPVDEDE